MSKIESGTLTTNGNDSSNESSNSNNNSNNHREEGKKGGFPRFQKQQPQQPVGSPPPAPSSTVDSSPATSWDARGANPGGPRPSAPAPSGAAGATAATRPMRPPEGSQEKEGGGRTGPGWGVFGREEASAGTGRVMVQRTGLADEAHGGGHDAAAAGSDGKGQEADHLRQDERAEDGEEESTWKPHNKPCGGHDRNGASPREGDDKAEEEEEEQGDEKERGQQVKHHESPVIVGRAAAEDHEVSAAGSNNDAGGTMQRRQLSEGAYDEDTQRPPSTPRSPGDMAFDHDTLQQLLPLQRPPRPGAGERDARGREQEDRPRADDSDGFQTQASPPQGYNSEGSYGYDDDDDLGAASDDDDLPRRNAEGGAHDTEVRQLEGLQQVEEQYDFLGDQARRSSSEDRANREEGQQEEEEEEEEEEQPQEGAQAMGSEGEGPERQRLQQHPRHHNQELQQQRSAPRGGSTTDDNRNSEDDNRNNSQEEKAAAEQDPDMLPPHLPADYGSERDEEKNEAEKKRPRQGIAVPQRERSADAPQPRGSAFGASSATGDVGEPEEENDQGHEANASAAAGHSSSSRAGEGDADAIVGGVGGESRFDRAMSSRGLDKSGRHGAPIALKSAAASGPLAVSRSSDTEQEGHRAKGGDVAMLGDGEGDEGYSEEEGRVLKRKREESQAILSRKVRDSFEKITNSFLAASSTISDVEAEQTKMIQDEERINVILVKSGNRVREAFDDTQMKLRAVFTGNGNGEGDLIDEPRRNKGGAPPDKRESPPATGGSAPPRNDGAPGRPTPLSSARIKVARSSATATAAASQQFHGGGGSGGNGGGGSGGRGSHRSDRSPQDDSPSIIASGRGSSDVSGGVRGDVDQSSSGNRVTPALPMIFKRRGGAGQGQQKLGPGNDRAVGRSSVGASRSSVSWGWANRSGPPPPHRGPLIHSWVVEPPNSGSDSTSELVGGGRAGLLSSSSSSSSLSSAKRPCRADFAGGHVAGESRADERA